MSRASGGGYTRVAMIAQGGLGVVDLVLRLEGKFRRVYARKRLHPHLREDPSVRAMFLEEARVAGLLRHPNVVGVLDVGEDADGPFLMMEFVDGLSLAKLVAQLRSSGELIPAAVALRIVRQAAEGLRAAHELVADDGTPTPLVHRDVSPQNILLGFDGIVRVVDFGIAKAAGSDTQTSTNVLKGKFGYMAPEQLRFQRADARSDLFSLGVVMWELLTGKRLFHGEPAMVARRILEDPPADLATERADVPPSLEQLSMSLLAKDREARVQSAQVLIERIDVVLREVEADEGPGDVAAFLTQRFGALRAETEAKRNQAVRDALMERTLEAAAAGEVAAPVTSAARKRNTRLILAVTAGVLIGAAALWGVQHLSSGGAEAEPVTAAAPAASLRTQPPATATDTATDTATAAATDTATATATETATEPATATETPTATEPEPGSRPAKRAVKRRRPRGGERPSGGAAATQWWD